MGDALLACIEMSMIEGVGHLANQATGGIPRQAGIRIQGDDIAHVPGESRGVVLLHHKGGIDGSAQQTIELVQLATLALPPHPAAFAGVEVAMTVKQKEAIPRWPRAIFAVQASNGELGLVQQGGIIGHDFMRGVHAIGEQGKAELATDPR